MTVEIGYALLSAAFAAAVVLGAVAGPAFAFDVSDGVRGTLVGSGVTVAVVVFFARVISVLVRFAQEPRAPRTSQGSQESQHSQGPQPSQPGRTNPDS